MKRLPIKLLWINNCTFIRHTLTMHCLCCAVINISIGLYHHYIHNKLWSCLWCVYLSYDTYKTMYITTDIIYTWVNIVKYSPANDLINVWPEDINDYLLIILIHIPIFYQIQFKSERVFLCSILVPKKIWFAHAKSMLLFIHYSTKCCILRLVLGQTVEHKAVALVIYSRSKNVRLNLSDLYPVFLRCIVCQA